MKGPIQNISFLLPCGEWLLLVTLLLLGALRAAWKPPKEAQVWDEWPYLSSDWFTTFIVVWKLLSWLTAQPWRPDVDKKGRAWEHEWLGGALTALSLFMGAVSFWWCCSLPLICLVTFSASSWVKRMKWRMKSAFPAVVFLASKLNIAILKTLGIKGGKNRHGLLILIYFVVYLMFIFSWFCRYMLWKGLIGCWDEALKMVVLV